MRVLWCIVVNVLFDLFIHSFIPHTFPVLARQLPSLPWPLPLPLATVPFYCVPYPYTNFHWLSRQIWLPHTLPLPCSPHTHKTHSLFVYFSLVGCCCSFCLCCDVMWCGCHWANTWNSIYHQNNSQYMYKVECKREASLLANVATPNSHPRLFEFCFTSAQFNSAPPALVYSSLRCYRPFANILQLFMLLIFTSNRSLCLLRLELCLSCTCSVHQQVATAKQH